MAHLTVARRTELFFSEVVAPLFRAAGFRKTRLTFARDHEGVRQIVQVHVAVTVSGGASPPEGYFRVWIGLDPLPSRATHEYECAKHVELRDLVPSAAASWRVPMTKGPKRAELAKTFTASTAALLAALRPSPHREKVGERGRPAVSSASVPLVAKRATGPLRSRVEQSTVRSVPRAR